MNHMAPMVKDDGTCFDSFENIMLFVACSQPTLSKIIAYWQEQGVLTRDKGWRNATESKASVYQFDEAAMLTRLKTQQAWFDSQKSVRKPTPKWQANRCVCVPPKPLETPMLKVAGKQMRLGASQLVENAKDQGGTQTDAFPTLTYVSIRKNTTDIKDTVSIITPDESSFSDGQNAPQANPNQAASMSTHALENTARPRMTLEQAGRILKAFESSAVNVICADCLASDAAKDGHCTRDDVGSACDSTNLVNRSSRHEWFNELQAQWKAYQRQRDAEHKLNLSALGLTRKDIVGRLDVPSMEQQSDMTKCRDKAATTSIAERRTFAKECYDSCKRHPLRKAWFLYATGMLDDEDEPEPWVTQLFADLKALGETK